MGAIHEFIGWGVVAIFTVGWMWAAVAAVLRRDAGERFWTWLMVAQVVVGVQALVGVVLLLMGRTPTTWLHVVYGFGPLLILLIGHALARELRRQQPAGGGFPPWAIFGLASFICFGLSLRALMTGLGSG